MNRRIDEEIPYRSPLAGIAASPQQLVPALDEQNFSSLKAVQGVLHDKLEELYEDFNAFTLAKGVNNATAAQDLLRQIAGRQLAYDILAPIVQAVDSAVETVDSKYREED